MGVAQKNNIMRLRIFIDTLKVDGKVFEKSRTIDACGSFQYLHIPFLTIYLETFKK